MGSNCSQPLQEQQVSKELRTMQQAQVQEDQVWTQLLEAILQASWDGNRPMDSQ